MGFDDQPIPSVSTEVHVLEATMAAPQVSRERQRMVWQRTIRLLESRPWHEQIHVSPFALWELVTSMGFRHARHFPETPTNVHFEALERILENQTANGGFQSAYTNAPNQEETALALTALRSALETLPPDTLRLRVQAAAEAGSAWLSRAIADEDARHPALWTGKVLMGSPHVLQALVLSSLIGMPPPDAREECPADPAISAKPRPTPSGLDLPASGPSWPSAPRPPRPC